LSTKAARALARLGVTVRTGALVSAIEADRVKVTTSGGEEEIRTRTILWGAGVQASPLGKKLAAATGVTRDRAARVIVEPDLTLPKHPEIFALGDLVSFLHQGGQALPGVAPVAMQQGRYVADVIQARLQGKPIAGPFRYRDKGNMATIGRNAAVAAV